MGKLIVVENDKVEGTDKHNVTGLGINPAPPPPDISYKGVGDFDYKGKMTGQLSNFVSIDNKPVALINSTSSLNPGETSTNHSGLMGKNFIPSSPTPKPPTLSITDAIGTGIPSATAGSSFVTVNNIKVLLDGDKIDTCDGLSIPMNSTVTAGGQSFVSCSA